jgi:predicted PurR-regulated permease PerM
MEDDARTQQWIHFLGLIAVTALGLFMSYLLAVPFLPALTSAVALAVVFMPLHQFIDRKMSRPSLAAGITVFLAVFLLVLPASLLGDRLVREAAGAARLLSSFVEGDDWRQLLAAHPRFVPITHWIESQVNLPRTGEKMASWLTSLATTLVQGSGAQLIATVITFYLLFYMLRDRRLALAALGKLSPLGRFDMKGLTARIADTIRATVYGTLTIAAIQGILGGLMFWWLGLPIPLLWGIFMAVAAIVPVLGAFVVWLPAALFLLLTGHEVQALILVLWGTIVVSTIDNLLYPMLVGDRLKTHTVPTFIALVGGLMVFGMPGLILGPVILTVTLYLLEYWHQHSVELPS